MIINVLVENTSISEELGSEHGFSLFIETGKRKVLFDVGASGLFLDNAKKLGLDISEVDYLVISHGHDDHGGGLEIFLEENKKAEVFIHRQAFERHYVHRLDGKLDFIGLNDNLKSNKQLIATSDRFIISKGIEVFSNVTLRKEQPVSNKGLIIEHNGKRTQDTFAHEQNLVIEEDGKMLLVTGCAHNGIINILEHFHDLYRCMPDYVIGGFHLSSRSAGNESDERIDKIGTYLNATKAKYYTCHCTGIEPYKRLKSIMGKNIDYIKTGKKLMV